ncbi:PP2C family protein-serine/threonine phosphatase [Streptomyces sulfonofaciens]|nr:PP2C family protein-serine/threonine phosphatase [Streptomyces sulfonofaciens]
MAVVIVVDVSLGPEGGLLPLVSLGPAFAGLVGSWRRTAVIGVVSLGFCIGLGIYDNLFQERRGFTAMASVAGVTVAGVLAAVARSRREAELAGVRSVSEVAQRVLMRPVPHRVGPLDVAVSYTSAVAEARIGGDLYEVADTAHGIRVIIGDVQGKGLAAVETAALVLGAFREAAHDEPDLRVLGARVERSAARELTDEKFVTALLGEVRDNGVVFLNYGHPAPMVVREDGRVDFPEPPAYATPLGLSVPGGDAPGPFRVDFAPGDQVLLYTDGVTEARDRSGAFYPLAEHAAFLLGPDAQRSLDALRENLAHYAGGPPHDDAAMLLLRHRPSGAAAPRGATAVR